VLAVSGFEVDHQLVLSRSLHREVGWLSLSADELYVTIGTDASHFASCSTLKQAQGLAQMLAAAAAGVASTASRAAMMLANFMAALA
jgi:hypothetical protein